MNPFVSKELIEDSRDFFGANDNIKIDLLKFYGRLQLEEFFDWFSVIDKFFEYKKMLKD